MHSCSGTDIDFPLFSRIILNLIMIISLKIVFSHAVVSGSNFQSFTTAERQQDCLWISLEAYAESPRATEIRNEAYV